MDNALLLNFVSVTVFSLMFAIGINFTFAQLTSLWEQPATLLRSLLAVAVTVPTIVFLVIHLFNLAPTVATGLAILAAAPGAPMMTKRTEGAGGEPTYAASLQLTLALLAVVITPLILALFYTLSDLVTANVKLVDVARQIGWVTFLPVSIGILIRRFAPKFSEKIKGPSSVLANILFFGFMLLIVTLLVVSADLRAMLNTGVGPASAIVVVIVAALITGHFLGGPKQETRSVLAIACIARNAGLALFIAGLSDYGQRLIPTMVTYVLLGSVLAIPYSIWSKQRLKRTAAQMTHDGRSP
ncbi:MAG: bile acid:sodium symporter family protein [Hyphomicrobiaceae bacterium]